MNNKINKMLTIITITIILISAFVFISLTKSTYSASDKYVVFKGVGQHDEEIIRSCKIGTDGKLASSCVDEIGKICTQWSKEKHLGICENGSCRPAYSGIPTATFKTMTFSDDEIYYCIGGSSTSTTYDWGCYVCDADPTIMQWAVDVQPSDSNCPGNSWHKDTSITDDKQCPPPTPEPACYECKNDKTIVEWRNDDEADDQCSAGYKKLTGKTKTQCTPPPYACYTCSDDISSTWIWTNDEEAASEFCSGHHSKVPEITTSEDCAAPEEPTPEDACYKCKNGSSWVWGDENRASTTCNGQYEKVTSVTTSANCKPPKTYACYECKADKKITKWFTDGLGDKNCQGGYNKTTKTQAECKYVPENPPTGGVKALITCFIAFVAMGISLMYLKKGV